MQNLKDFLDQILGNRPSPLADVPDNEYTFNYSPSYGIPGEIEENKNNQDLIANKNPLLKNKNLSSELLVGLKNNSLQNQENLPETIQQPIPFENEYLKALEKSLELKQKLIDRQRNTDLLKASVMAFTGVSNKDLENVKAVYDEEKELAESPLKLVDAKYVGEKKQRELMQANEKLNPNSQVTKLYKENFIEMANKLGLKNLAENIAKTNISAAQLEDLVGQINLQNLFNTKLANDSRLDRLMLKLSEKGSGQDEEKLFKKEDNLRRFITSRKDLSDDRIAYQKSIELQDSLNDIKNALSSGQKIDTQAQSAQSLFAAMKLIQQDNSVVREGEYKNIIGSFGTIENLERQIRQDLLRQGAISPGMLSSLEKLAKFYQKHLENKIYNKLKPDVKRIEDQKLDTERILDEDLKQIYNKQKLREELKGKKLKIENGKIVVEE